MWRMSFSTRAAGGAASTAASGGGGGGATSLQRSAGGSAAAVGPTAVLFWHAGVHRLDSHLPQPLEVFAAATPVLAPRWALLAAPGPADVTRTVAPGVWEAPVGRLCVSVVSVSGGAAIAAWNLGIWRESTMLVWRQAARLARANGGFLATTRVGVGAVPATSGRGGDGGGGRGGGGAAPGAAVPSSAANTTSGPRLLLKSPTGPAALKPSPPAPTTAAAPTAPPATPPPPAASQGVGAGLLLGRGSSVLLAAAFPCAAAGLRWSAELIAFGLLADW